MILNCLLHPATACHTHRIPSTFPHLHTHRSYNKLTGTIPSALANMHRLSRLNFQYNALSGTIPPALFEQVSMLSLRQVQCVFLPTCVFFKERMALQR